MQRITGHHWITHVAVVLILFVIFACCFARINGGRGPKMPVHRLTRVVFAGVVAGVFIVLGFYVFAD
jgi:uncharacterized BrkB/YihY/UPF0761 family membrane protein